MNPSSRSILLVLLSALALLLVGSGSIAAATDDGTPEFLFVLNGTSGSLGEEQLVLTGVPSVIFFSERPERTAGHVSVAAFIESWSRGTDSFAEVPPNAVVTFLDEAGVSDVVAELRDPRIEADELVFDVEIIEGTPPEGRSGPVAVFIDPDTVAPMIT